MKEVAAKQEAKDKLPETGTSKSEHLFFLASLSLANVCSISQKERRLKYNRVLYYETQTPSLL